MSPRRRVSDYSQDNFFLKEKLVQMRGIGVGPYYRAILKIRKN